MLELLKNIPDTVYAALIAALITLFGVLLANRHHYKLQKKQLKHATKENQADRFMELRKSVYLEAVSELTSSISNTMGLSDIDISKTKPDAFFKKLQATAAKAALISSDNTAFRINTFVGDLGEVLLTLLPDLLTINEARSERNIQDNAYQKYQMESSRILASISQFNEEARTDKAIWDALSAALDFNSEQAKIAADARHIAWKDLNNLKQEFSIKSFHALKEVSRLLPGVLASIRSEINLETDIDKYIENAELQLNKAEAAMEAAFKQINEKQEEFENNQKSKELKGK
ncbi:MAG: hypothetical protein HWE16_08585 [Gammaproteobacteria bacterium]|nr:hypothetical protein [Gammaproteobacteria bacterium]